MKKILIIPLLLFSIACNGSLRHKLVVTSATSHAILTATRDTVNLVTCSDTVTTNCIGHETRKVIADDFIKAFNLDEDAAKAIRNWDGTTPAPSQLASLLSDITKLVEDILALIPSGKQKTQLEVEIGVK